MKHQFKLNVCAALMCCQFAQANQVPTDVVNGNVDERNSLVALTNATIHFNGKESIENATLLIQQDRIIGIDNNNTVPEEALVKDYAGMHIYPGFIHLDSSLGLPKPDPRPPFQWTAAEVINSTTEGAYNSNEAIKSSYQAAEHFTNDEKSNAKYRAAGFTTALSHRKDGIMRGTSVLTQLSKQDEALNVIASQAAQHYSFDKGSSKQNYPVSLMGVVALIRQTWLDAQWYQQQNQMTDLDLAAINATMNLPKIIETRNWQQTLLANKMAQEFDTQFVVKTAADSYQNLAAVKSTGQTLIVPLTSPKAPSIKDSLDEWNVDYKDLKAWEVAPFNPALLAQQGISFALVPDGSPKGIEGFLKDLRSAVKHGLDEDTAIQALTSIPAEILGSDELGNIEQGHYANFIVTNGPIMEESSYVAETWVSGVAHKVKGMPVLQPGIYQLTDDSKTHTFKISNKLGKFSAAAAAEDDKTSYQLNQSGNFVTLTIKHEDNSHQYLAAISDRRMTPIDPADWQIVWTGALPEEPQDQEPSTKQDSKSIPEIPKPFTAYGLAQVPEAEPLLIQNATVWTNEDEGILSNSDVVVGRRQNQSNRTKPNGQIKHPHH